MTFCTAYVRHMPANYLPAKSGRRHWLRWLPHRTLEFDVPLGSYLIERLS
jgi:hypothetical protein